MSKHMSCDVESSAKVLWNYQLLNDVLVPADAAIVLGSHDIRVADHAAEIYHRALAPIFVFTGGSAPATRAFYVGTEAEAFAERALTLGMPDEVIRIEPNAMNTADNLRFSLDLLSEEGVHPRRVIIVQKPYMERRGKATADIVCPEIETMCTSPRISFEEYASGEFSREHFINTMVGDFQRIIEYPSLGFMSEQDIPDEAMQAFECLVKLGYTTRLLV